VVFEGGGCGGGKWFGVVESGVGAEYGVAVAEKARRDDAVALGKWKGV